MRVVLFCISLLCTPSVRSQDKPLEPTVREIEQLKSVVIEAVDLQLDNEIIGVDPSFRVYSGSGGHVFLSGYPAVNQNLLDYLTASHVQQHVELSADQKQQLSEMRKQLAAGMKKISDRYPGRHNPKLPAEIKAKVSENYSVEIKALRKKFEEQVEESLVPQQLKLIKQLKFNSSVRMLGFSRTLSQKPFSDETKVTTKQAKELKEIKKEAEAAIEEKIAEMRAAAKEKMLKVLDSQQRKAIKELEGNSNKNPLKKL